MKKLLITLICLLFITGCGSKTTIYDNYEAEKSYTSSTKVKAYTDISYVEYKEMLDKNESFLILLWQTGCTHCEAFEPTLNQVIKQYNLKVYGLNLAEISEDEYAIVQNKTFISGTPTLVFFKNGKNDSKLVGEKSETELLTFLTKIGYLKEK